MDEDPKDHNFDERRDGPMQEPSEGKEHTVRPSVQIDTNLPKRTQSEEGGKTKSNSTPDISNTKRDVSSPQNVPARHSTQLSRTDENGPRRSTQIGRSSRDFDRRTDGPFGRPSLTMSRRKSSGMGVSQSPGAPPVLLKGEETQQAKEEEQAPSDQVPPSVETMQSTTDPAFEPEPPPLNYTLYTRKMSIFLFWSLVLIDSIAMPIVLYFCLWYLTDLSPNTVFSIVTAALGGVSILEYFVRFWRLWKKDSKCRVIGARRMYLDWFHWNFTFAWIIIMIELIVGSVPEHPPIRLLSMPLATMCYTFGCELMIVDICRYFQCRAPCRISSIPKGAQLRPGIYSIIEDVIAVDGSGGTQYREELNRRYEASHMFRAMLRRLGEFWAFGAQMIATLTTILIFTLSEDAAYSVGWSVPFVWAGIWTAVTIWYVKKKLKEEKKAWAEEVSAKSNA